MGHAVTLRLTVPSAARAVDRQGTVAKMEEDLFDLLQEPSSRS